MTVSVRPATPDDAETVHRMIAALAAAKTDVAGQTGQAWHAKLTEMLRDAEDKLNAYDIGDCGTVLRFLDNLVTAAGKLPGYDSAADGLNDHPETQARITKRLADLRQYLVKGQEFYARTIPDEIDELLSKAGKSESVAA